MIKSFLSVIFFLNLSLSLFGSKQIEERVKKIPFFERLCIRCFCDFAINHDQAAHVLCFNNKPICFTDVIIKYKDKKLIDHLCLKGYYAFKKYESLFPHPNFVINEQKNESEDLISINIFIINKQALIQCLQEFITLFKNNLNQNFTPELFISELENGVPIRTLINDNEMLFGILLGYGEEAAKAYQDTRLTDGSTPEWTETYAGIESSQPKGCKIYPIAFMGNPKSSKTRQLLSVYGEELQSIWDEYRKKNDPLLFFLEHLCRESS